LKIGGVNRKDCRDEVMQRALRLLPLRLPQGDVSSATRRPRTPIRSTRGLGVPQPRRVARASSRRERPPRAACATARSFPLASRASCTAASCWDSACPNAMRAPTGSGGPSHPPGFACYHSARCPARFPPRLSQLRRFTQSIARGAPSTWRQRGPCSTEYSANGPPSEFSFSEAALGEMPIPIVTGTSWLWFPTLLGHPPIRSCPGGCGETRASVPI